MKLTQIHTPQQDKVTYIKGEREKTDRGTLNVGKISCPRSEINVTKLMYSVKFCTFARGRSEVCF